MLATPSVHVLQPMDKKYLMSFFTSCDDPKRSKIGIDGEKRTTYTRQCCRHHFGIHKLQQTRLERRIDERNWGKHLGYRRSSAPIGLGSQRGSLRVKL
jgi:hypothetical protein